MLIGFTGYAKHGKDSSAAVLVNEYGFRRYAFADQLKSMALSLNPIIRSYSFPKHPERLSAIVRLLGWDKAKEDQEVRRFLQVLGTEAVRGHLGENAWVDALQQKLVDDNQIWYSYHPSDGAIAQDARIAVTDVRFPNEAGWVTKMGGRMVRVVRVNEDGSPFDNGVGINHPSEQYIADLPVEDTITAYTLDDLHSGIRELVEKYGIRKAN